MDYYYHSHIRNLQDEALLQRKKIGAQLHEKELLSLSQLHLQSTSKTPQKQSRESEDRQTAAYLQRSRLSAELSAMRSKAEASMNRSRLQSAFQLRKENQKAMQELLLIDRKSKYLQEMSLRQEYQAQLKMLASQEHVQEAIQHEIALEKLMAADAHYLDTVRRERSRGSAFRDRYAWPY